MLSAKPMDPVALVFPVKASSPSANSAAAAGPAPPLHIVTALPRNLSSPASPLSPNYNRPSPRRGSTDTALSQLSVSRALSRSSQEASRSESVRARSSQANLRVVPEVSDPGRPGQEQVSTIIDVSWPNWAVP